MKTKKRVWIVNHHASIPSKDGRSGRHMSLARYLESVGWVADLLVASTTHPSGEQRLKGVKSKHVTEETGIKCLWLRVPSYEASSFRRIVGMLAFAGQVLAVSSSRDLPKPDVIVGSTVHPFAAWAASRLSAREQVPFVYEIRDVWPESLIDLGKASSTSVSSKIFRWLARDSISRCSLVISPLPHVDAYLREYGFLDKPFMWVSNGADIEDMIDAGPIIAKNSFTFMYLGAHGHANALEGLIEAFSIASTRRPDLNLRLRLIGEGPLKDNLISFAAGMPCATSISFEAPVPKKDVLARASESDCLVANIYDRPVYRFGVSLNKFFTYLLSGRPVVLASSAPNNPVADAGAGYTVQGDNREQFADAMIRMAEAPVLERQSMADSGAKYIKENFAFDILASRFAQGLESVLASNTAGLSHRG